MAKKTRGTVVTGTNRAYPDGRSRENTGSDGTPTAEDRGVQYNPYSMDVNKERNCYACGEFEHLARYCRNREAGNRIGEGRRLEYRQENRQNNLKEEGDLIVFN